MISLRALESADITDTYLRWINDPEVTKYMSTGIFPQNRQTLKNYYKNAANNRDAVYFAIILEGIHIGNCQIFRIDWRNRKCEFGILIGEKEQWGKGICKEVLSQMCAYAFEKLNLNKMSISTIGINKRALQCYKSLGFRNEGLQSDMWFSDGRYEPNILLGLTQSEWNERTL